MLIIGDQRLPVEAKQMLNKFGELVEFYTQNIVYESISGHPDIFFHLKDSTLIVAPNLPQHYFDILKQTHFKIVIGKAALGLAYPDTAKYNAAYNTQNLFCNSKNIDNQIVKLHSDKTVIHLNQGYTACNMVVGKNSILTSDQGICRKLNVGYFNPKEILLPGVSNGFLGGCCAIFNYKLFLIGSLKYIKQRLLIEQFAIENELEIIELYQGSLFDGGGLIFIP